MSPSPTRSRARRLAAAAVLTAVVAVAVPAPASAAPATPEGASQIDQTWRGIRNQSAIPAYFRQPTGDAQLAPDGVGSYRWYRGDRGDGAIYWRPPLSSAHEIYGPVLTLWSQMGWERGLGYPMDEELTTPDYQGSYQVFGQWTGGGLFGFDLTLITNHPRWGVNAVYGAISTSWQQNDWIAGPYGYPLTNEQRSDGGSWSACDAGDQEQWFAGRASEEFATWWAACWHPATGVVEWRTL
jgi:uncharacterized protein with LGFP repeats